MKKSEIIARITGVKGVKVDQGGVVTFAKRPVTARTAFTKCIYQLLSEIVNSNVQSLEGARQQAVMLLRTNASLIARREILPMTEPQQQRLEDTVNVCFLYMLVHNVSYPTDVQWEKLMQMAGCLTSRQDKEVIDYLQEYCHTIHPTAEKALAVA